MRVLFEPILEQASDPQCQFFDRSSSLCNRKTPDPVWQMTCPYKGWEEQKQKCNKAKYIHWRDML